MYLIIIYAVIINNTIQIHSQSTTCEHYGALLPPPQLVKHLTTFNYCLIIT